MMYAAVSCTSNADDVGVVVIDMSTRATHSLASLTSRFERTSPRFFAVSRYGARNRAIRRSAPVRSSPLNRINAMSSGRRRWCWIPETLSAFNLSLSEDRRDLTYTYDTQAERTGITRLLAGLSAADIRFRDLETTQSSLEDIFIGLVRAES